MMQRDSTQGEKAWEGHINWITPEQSRAFPLHFVRLWQVLNDQMDEAHKMKFRTVSAFDSGSLHDNPHVWEVLATCQRLIHFFTIAYKSWRVLWVFPTREHDWVSISEGLAEDFGMRNRKGSSLKLSSKTFRGVYGNLRNLGQLQIILGVVLKPEPLNAE